MLVLLFLQMIQFTSSSDKLLFTWPPKQTIDDFTAATGTELVKQNVGTFYQAILTELSSMQSDLKEMETELTTAINQQISSLASYNETSYINEDFIRCVLMECHKAQRSLATPTRPQTHTQSLIQTTSHQPYTKVL